MQIQPPTGKARALLSRSANFTVCLQSVHYAMSQFPQPRLNDRFPITQNIWKSIERTLSVIRMEAVACLKLSNGYKMQD